MRRAVIYLQYHYAITIFDVLWEHDAKYHTLLRLIVFCTDLCQSCSRRILGSDSCHPSSFVGILRVPQTLRRRDLYSFLSLLLKSQRRSVSGTRYRGLKYPSLWHLWVGRKFERKFLAEEISVIERQRSMTWVTLRREG
jgi:hypothetical protein